MTLTFIIDGKLVEGTGKTFTLSDPGGCESASIEQYGSSRVNPGSRALVLDGTTPLFLGTTEEPGAKQAGADVSSSIGLVGRVAQMQDKLMTALYIDRDLSRWENISAQRQIALMAAGFSGEGNVETSYDLTYGAALRLSRVDAGGANSVVEAWYDAGELNRIGRAVFDYSIQAAEPSAGSAAFYGVDDEMATGAVQVTFSYVTGGPVSIDTSVITGKRMMIFQSLYSSAVALDPAITRQITVFNIVVIGNHGIKVDGDVAQKTLHIKLGRIVEDAWKKSKVGGSARIDPTTIPVWSLTYPDYVASRQVIDDAVKMSGYHFGVWPGSMLDPYSPETLFQRPSPVPTAVASYSDLENPDITERFSGMNRQARVTYTLAAGNKSGSLIVTREHPRLPIGEGGILEVDAGTVGSKTVAETYGLFALAIDQAQSRGAGSVTLPKYVMTPTGAFKPSHHLRPGVDRLQITNLPQQYKLISETSERGDSFRISRLTVTEDEGRLTTVAEIDQGADLIEVMQARVSTSDPTGLLGG